jgi:hypothetical protein
MCDELHLHLSVSSVTPETKISFLSTYEYVRTHSVVHTTIPHFLNWKYSKRLFVHVYGKTHEIDREKYKGQNIEKILFDGKFNWF